MLEEKKNSLTSQHPGTSNQYLYAKGITLVLKLEIKYGYKQLAKI
jgi:hypothetical protein